MHKASPHKILHSLPLSLSISLSICGCGCMCVCVCLDSVDTESQVLGNCQFLAYAFIRLDELIGSMNVIEDVSDSIKRLFIVADV